MTHLKVMSLSDNSFSGELPNELGDLTSLERLEIAGNHIKGAIPTSMGNLTNLNTLVLAENQIAGKFPETVLELPKLRILQLQKNNLDRFHLMKVMTSETNIALLDYDVDDNRFKRDDFKKIYEEKNTGTADTKFEE